MSNFNFPNNPHAIIEVSKESFDSKTKKKASVSVGSYDSWENEGLFKGVDVELVTNGTSEAAWQVFDPKFKIINSFAENKSLKSLVVRVYLGFGKNLGEPVFKGILANAERDKADTTLTFYDMGLKMKQVKTAEHRNKKTDLDIIKLLAERNGLLFSPPENPKKLEPHRAMMQDEQSDWEHATERARDAGLLLFVREDTLFARYPAKLTYPKLILENRNAGAKAFYDFRILFKKPENESVRPRVVKFRGRGKGGKRLEGESDKNTKGREIITLKKSVAGKATKAKLSARAQAQKDLEKEHAFEGSINFPFLHQGIRLDVRDTLAVEGIGELFSQAYICDTVRYQFGAGKINLDVDLYRDFTQE